MSNLAGIAALPGYTIAIILSSALIANTATYKLLKSFTSEKIDYKSLVAVLNLAENPLVGIVGAILALFFLVVLISSMLCKILKPVGIVITISRIDFTLKKKTT